MRSRVVWWTLRYLCLAVLKVVFRLHSTHKVQLPKDGPYLLVGNHTSALDPFFVGVFCRRIVHFMGSDSLFRNPFLAAFLRACGTFPKKVGVADLKSVKTLIELYREDQIITFFPEGTRTWDGRSLPISPGLGRLVKRLGARVVCCRILTGHLAMPRWAKGWRWVPVALEFSDPIQFSKDDDPDDICARVAAELRLDLDSIKIPPRSFGSKLAHGLPDYLWACPACLTIDALEVAAGDDDVVECGSCGASWRVDVGNRMHPVSDGGKPLTVATAWDCVEKSVGSPPVSASSSDGVVLSSGEDIELRDRGVVVACGRATLTVDAFTIEGESGNFVVALNELRTATVEFKNVVYIKSVDRVLSLHTAGQESALKWRYFLKAYIPRPVPTPQADKGGSA